MDEWWRTDFHVRFPPRRTQGVCAFKDTRPSTQPTRPARLPNPTIPSRDSLKRVCEDELLNFLSSPHNMIGKQFVHSPRQAQDLQEYSGTWEVVS